MAPPPSGTHRLVNWLPWTAGRPALPSALNGNSISVTEPPAAVMAASDGLPYVQFLGLLIAGLITSEGEHSAGALVPPELIVRFTSAAPCAN